MNAISGIHSFENWKTILPIEKGWSSDKKYFVESIAGEKLLLRISDIHGYFDGEQPPAVFFRRMALYTAINALFSIVWSIPFGEKEIKGDLERSRMNYEDYKGFTTIIPSWWGND